MCCRNEYHQLYVYICFSGVPRVNLPLEAIPNMQTILHVPTEPQWSSNAPSEHDYKLLVPGPVSDRQGNMTLCR